MYILLVRDESKKLRITSTLKRIHNSLIYYKNNNKTISMNIYRYIQIIVLTTNKGNIYRRSHMTGVYTLIT